MTNQYKLSCEIYGHNGDVRSVAVTNDGKILSGSRDMIAKLWVPDESGHSYRESLTLSSHNNFVSSVCFVPPSEKFKSGLLLTGSNDKQIRVFDCEKTIPVECLSGHSNTICKIVVGAHPNTILTSSWDQTAKLWDLNSFKLISTFSGHVAAVWSVVQLPSEVIATGSADKQIKIWSKNGTCINTIQAHKDCVRDLAIAGPDKILSCSNDASIKLWNVETSQCLNTFYGHNHFIYTIYSIDSSFFLSSSEDHSVKLWKNGEVIETIQIPATTVWTVAALPNGDIVTGSSDGAIRVFTKNPERQASSEQLKSYADQVSNFENFENQAIGGVKVSELPGEEALLENGTKDGQTRMIKVENKVIAYCWSMSEGKWKMIGDVVGSNNNNKAGETGKQFYNGKEYDFVFSVDVEPGKPLLKLPFNKEDDPWQAAQKFINDNDLSQMFLEEVVNFILRNTKESDEPITNSSEFVDPYTGGSKYIPSSNSSGARPMDVVRDTFNGNSNNSFFPQREYLTLDRANLNLILQKLLEFNKKSSNSSQIISEEKIQNLVEICESNASFRLEHVDTLNQLLEWPEDIVFPVLDLLRLVIRNTEANNYLCNDKLIPMLMNYLSPGSKVTPNTMLALRVLANMLSCESGQKLGDRNRLKLLKILESVPPPYSVPVQLAMSTLLLNIAVMLRRSETPGGRPEALNITQNFLAEFTDREALFRTFVALGTLLFDWTERRNYSSTFQTVLLKYQSDSSADPKVQQCCQYILQVLQ